MQYVANRGMFFFYDHLTTQLCDMRTLLECNMWRIEENTASVITYTARLFKVRTVLEFNMWREEETSASVIN
jgi:hypothetical protein